MIYILILLFDIALLALWYRYKKKKGKKIPWYFGWVFPTDIIFLIAIIIGLVAALLIATDVIPLNERRTKKEMSEIRQSIIKFNTDTGTYPKSMNELIGSHPLRESWRLDYWENEYKFEFKNNHIVFVISAGKDLKFNTKDDLKMKIHN